uniref:Uncharacterized protein n=1 Tax=Anguilla anguilla TaxID=7936 RepID=A0A0E9XBP1_ANGAN
MCYCYGGRPYISFKSYCLCLFLDMRMQVRDRRHCIRQHAATGLFVDIQQVRFC